MILNLNLVIVVIVNVILPVILRPKAEESSRMRVIPFLSLRGAVCRPRQSPRHREVAQRITVAISVGGFLFQIQL